MCYNTAMPSKRNKTITISDDEINQFHNFSILETNATKENISDTIFYGNALQSLEHIPDASVSLLIADPPYNLNKNFGQGSIKMNAQEYREWCQTWLTECARILKDTGTIYVCCDWSYSGMFKELLETHFSIRNRITWKRDKGRGSKTNWKNNMEDIWYATKSNKYVFNLDEVKVKKEVIAPYVDKSGKPKDWFEEKGKKYRRTHPSNIWTDMTVPFWSMPENTEHPTQKPEKLIERLIQASSNVGDLIFDPFMGSGTVAVVAKRLNRHYSGFEIDKRYYVLAQKRLNKIKGLKPKLVIATHNQGKVDEFKKFLNPLPIKLLSLKEIAITEDVEETGTSFEENAFIKATFFHKKTGLPTLSDDGGLEIDALNGEPGIKSRRWAGHRMTDQEMVDYTLEKLRNVPPDKRTARLTLVICYIETGKAPIYIRESIEALITEEAVGKITPGYPFRVLLKIPAFNKMYGELKDNEIAQINHRFKACQQLITKIKNGH